MTTPELAVATPAHRPQVVRTLVAAFTADPVLRFLFPADDTYPAQAAAFFGYLFDRRVGGGSVWVADGGLSVAVWESPAGADPGVPEPDLDAAALARMKHYDEQVHSALPPRPFWYLGVLGTHPDAAGRRWGRLVMAEGLRRAAADGVPAVLETSNPGNVDVYRRAGWRVLRTVGHPVPTWIMQQ